MARGGESGSRGSDPGPATGVGEERGVGKETKGISSGGLSLRPRCPGWWWKVGTAAPLVQSAGLRGSGGAGEGNRSANSIPRPLGVFSWRFTGTITSASASQSVAFPPKLGSLAPAVRYPRPRSVEMKSRGGELRRRSDANTSVVFNFPLWACTWVAAFLCNPLPARR